MRAVKSVTIDSERRVIITFLDGSTETLYPNLICCDAEALRDIIKELLEEKADAIVQTIENVTVATFEDGADEALIRKLLVSIEPIQDLHGYDNPWPAGGGKNLLEWDKVSLVSNTHYGMTFSKGVVEGTITLSGTLTVNSGSVGAITYADNSLSGKGYVFLAERISGDSVVELTRTYGFRTESERTIAIYLAGTSGQSYTETIRISVYAPPAPSSWSPYSNICPISGRTGLTVYHSGSDTSDPTTISVNWETEAGTVYGGTLDVISGKLTVNRAYKEFSTADGWTALTTENVFRSASLDPAIKTVDTSTPVNAITNETNVIRYRYDDMKANYPSISADTTGRLYLAISDDVLTVKQLNTWLQTNPLQVCYEIAEPHEIQLTSQEITTLLGSNNIWADSGNILELEYVADTKLYIGESQSGTLGSGRQTITNPNLQPVSEKTLEDVGEAHKAETVGEKTHDESNDERGE